MKFIITLIFMVTQIGYTIACVNSLPLSEAVKAVNLEAGAGSKSCKDLPSEQCLCFDGVDFEEVELEDIMVLDFNTKREVESCVGDSDCQDKLVAKICSDNQEIAIKNLDLLEVYCSKEVLKNSGLKKFKKNAAKKAAREAIKAAEKQAEKDEKDEIKSIKQLIKDDATISEDVKKVLKYLLKNL